MAQSYMLGVEIGGTKLQVGLGQGDGRIDALERRAVDPDRGANGILEQIDGMIVALLAQVGATRAQLDAVGIGFGGPVDAERGVVTKSHHVVGWDRFPLADWFREHTGVMPVSLHNDADTAGLAEAAVRGGERGLARPVRDRRQRHRRRPDHRRRDLPGGRRGGDGDRAPLDRRPE